LVKIEWTEAAIKDLEKLDRPVIQRILRRLTVMPFSLTRAQAFFAICSR